MKGLPFLIKYYTESTAFLSNMGLACFATIRE